MNIKDYEVGSPKQLIECCEFWIDSQSFDPSFSGPIDIRVEPKRIGVRWSGQKDWSWMEWHELPLFAGESSKLFREKIADIYERAREEGMNAGTEESCKPKIERKPTISVFPQRAS